MAALVDLSDVLNRLTGGSSGTPEHIHPFKIARLSGLTTAPAAPVAGRWTSLWQYSGTPMHGSAPGAVAIPDRNTAGALGQADAGGGRDKWLLGVSGMVTAPGTLIIYDRLLHSGNLSGTVLTPQAVGGTLARNVGGRDNQIWVEIYTQIGTTQTTVTASYTDQDGNPGVTQATPMGGTGLREAQRIIPLPFAAGDNGARAVASVTLAGTTGTAGAFGVTVANVIAVLPLAVSSVATIRDFVVGLPGPVLIEPDACLAMAFLANGVTVPEFYGSLHFVEA